MRAIAAVLLLSACHSTGGGSSHDLGADASVADLDGGGADAAMFPPIDLGALAPPGVPLAAGSPWLSFYGNATMAGDLAMVAASFRLINIDVDPDGMNFTAAQVTTLKNNGANRVISYLNVGSCEDTRAYWTTVPAPYVSCSANLAAQLSVYEGYPHEVWMDVGNADYQKLIVEYVAPRLAAVGVDGFFLDNMEVVENTFNQQAVTGNAMTPRGCEAACSQGGLDLVRMLRAKFPDKLIIMQNATGDVTRMGSTAGIPFPLLLDGLSHEEVYDATADPASVTQLKAWQSFGLMPGGHPFWISTEDYGSTSATGACPATSVAMPIYAMSKADGFSPYVTDASAGQNVVCYYPF